MALKGGEAHHAQDLGTVVSWFSELPAAQKVRTFEQLIDSVKDDTAIVSAVASILEPHTKVDFLERLPDKLAKHILSFCDARSLTVCAQVSKKWRGHANDDTLWHRMCAQHINRKCKKCMKPISMGVHVSGRGGWGLPLVTDVVSEGDDESGRKRRRKSWKDIYAERMQVECNWRKGHYKLRKLTGHTDSVNCLEFDGARVVSGGEDRTIRVWDLKTGKVERILQGHEDGVSCLQFDRVRLISGSRDGFVRIWCLQTGECVRSIEAHQGGVCSLQFDDQRLATGGEDSNIRVWTYGDGKCHVLNGHTDSVTCVRLHSGLLLSSSEDHTVRVWDLATMTCTLVLEGHRDQVRCAQLSHGTIVSGSLDNTIKIWDLKTGKCKDTLFGHTGGVSFVQFDNLRIVSASEDGTVKIWDLQSGRCMHTLKGHQASVNTLQFDDTKIVTGSDDHCIKIWDFGAQ